MKSDSKYLENERSIPLSLPLAQAFGVPKAIILQQIRYWMSRFQAAEQDLPEHARRHYHDGRWWVWNTYEDWKIENFDFWSASKIARHIRDLERLGVLLSATLNKRSGDRTKWYSIDFDRLDRLTDVILAEKHCIPITSKWHDGGGMTPFWNDDMTPFCSEQDGKMTRPLPESTSYINTEIDQKIKEIWQTARVEIQMQLPRETFDTWLRHSLLADYIGGTFVIAVHNVYSREWCEYRLKKVIVRTLKRIVKARIDETVEVDAQFVVKGQTDVNPRTPEQD